MSTTRISQTFADLAAKGQGALIPFLTLGYPSIAEGPALIEAMVAGGADLIELGIAFSDPMADGPTIQACSQQALANGITLKKSLAMIREVRQRGVTTPMLLMGYANPFLAFGLPELAKAAHAAGIDALIVADLPPGEAKPWRQALAPYGIELIFFVGPTTSDERLQKITAEAAGFLYCLALTGVTGARSSVAADLAPYLQRVRRYTKLPLAVGFGLSQPEHVEQVIAHADAAIVASALMAGLGALPPEKRVDYVRQYVATLKAATMKRQ